MQKKIPQNSNILGEEGSASCCTNHASSVRNSWATAILSLRSSAFPATELWWPTICACSKPSSTAAVSSSNWILPATAATAAASASTSQLSEFPTDFPCSTTATTTDAIPTTETCGRTSEAEASDPRGVHLHANGSWRTKIAMHCCCRESGKFWKSFLPISTWRKSFQQTKRKLEDVSKRLELLYDLLRENRVS